MKIQLKVKGMHCKSCEALIKDSVEELPGINEVKADHNKGIIQVTFDESRVKESKIKEAIKKEGYKL